MVSAPPTPSMVDSVVQCRRIRATLQADASGTLSIFVPPWPYGTLLTRSSIGDLADNCDYGGIMYSTNNEQYHTLMALDPITDGPSRIVGFGWELINTTPNMYKSGSLLVYQCP